MLDKPNIVEKITFEDVGICPFLGPESETGDVVILRFFEGIVHLRRTCHAREEHRSVRTHSSEILLPETLQIHIGIESSTSWSAYLPHSKNPERGRNHYEDKNEPQNVAKCCLLRRVVILPGILAINCVIRIAKELAVGS